MSSPRRTLADWIWTFVGLAGVACIGVAAWLFLAGGKTPTPEEAAKARQEKAQELWQEGEKQAGAGDASAAVETMRNALGIMDPRTPGYLDRLLAFAKVLIQADNAAGAESVLRQALLMYPRYYRTHLVYAAFLEDAERYREALYRYRAALALHPDPVPDSLAPKLADLEAKVDMTKESEAALSALRANPAHSTALFTLLLIDLLDEKVPAEAEPDAALRAALEAVALEAGDLDEFLARQESAVADRPESVVDRAGLGCVLLLRLDGARAAEAFAAALSLSEGDPVSMAGVALADLLVEPTSGERIEKAAAAQPLNPITTLALGIHYLRAGDGAEALKALGGALVRNPGLPEVYRLLARAFAAVGQTKDEEAALRAYRRLTE